MYDMFLFLYWYWIRPIISKRPIVYVRARCICSQISSRFSCSSLWYVYWINQIEPTVNLCSKIHHKAQDEKYIVLSLEKQFCVISVVCILLKHHFLYSTNKLGQRDCMINLYLGRAGGICKRVHKGASVAWLASKASWSLQISFTWLEATIEGATQNMHQVWRT